MKVEEESTLINTTTAAELSSLSATERYTRASVRESTNPLMEKSIETSDLTHSDFSTQHQQLSTHPPALVLQISPARSLFC
jgi:hypothetical protein